MRLESQVEDYAEIIPLGADGATASIVQSSSLGITFPRSRTQN